MDITSVKVILNPSLADSRPLLNPLTSRGKAYARSVPFSSFPFFCASTIFLTNSADAFILCDSSFEAS